ncbi:hypothetical protein HHK36_006846 [Tetracentron sinense]|uniref:Uncharacterized protein n=1 Tax=Tetracentron sinense TaxID=13715 RepID=A0A834ZIR3_TETSI|nr:hypothetical protein HHK36_006846 [Tetracentron sinense]
MNEKANKLPGSYPMNKGDGPFSYAQNSCYQRGVVDAAKEMINAAITDKLDIKHLSFASLNAFYIADFGCSVGPNTFIAVQNILDPVEFNDTSQLAYLVHSTIAYFPRPPSILYSSYALYWLSKVPKEVLDINPPTWNKGRIHYPGSAKEVVEAYSAQYAKDMESFLYARAQEVVDGGLMTLLIASLPDGILHSHTTTVSEAKVDSFNLPIYYTSPKEFEAIIENNGYFSIERMEKMDQPMRQATPNLQMCTLHMRAAMEGLIKEHFGSEIIENCSISTLRKMQSPPSS